MKRTPVDSSALHSVGYDEGLAMLEIEFVSGEVYRYHAVPASIHRELMDAESRGRYFVENVRDVYPATRLP